MKAEGEDELGYRKTLKGRIKRRENRKNEGRHGMVPVGKHLVLIVETITL